MSSNLKDARWQLAHDIAEGDGKNFWDMPHATRNVYLWQAQARLEKEPDLIDGLAEKWREQS